MRIEIFDLERGQSLWEHKVELNLSESGVHPVTLRDLESLGLDLAEIEGLALGYVQTNGTPELRRALSRLYPGSHEDCFEVTNGTAEANYLVTQTLLHTGDTLLCETPNYLQVSGVARNLGARVETFGLQQHLDWAPDWDAFQRGLEHRPRLIYVSHPNNPTGYVLSEDEVELIVEGARSVDAWLLADEVYRGAELDGEPSTGFWGSYDKTIVTCGLSKAYGIPGARIGWVAGPPELVDRCWHLHDYTTIAPAALSDRIAQFAVRPEIKEQLHERARGFMVPNRDLFREWVSSLEGLVEYREPRAGAYGFVRYRAEVDSEPLCTTIRERQSVLLVAGAWMGMEKFLRISLGTPREELEEGLRRVGEELRKASIV
jgi:aspartate/methionine/tyrosine aminotransferase